MLFVFISFFLVEAYQDEVVEGDPLGRPTGVEGHGGDLSVHAQVEHLEEGVGEELLGGVVVVGVDASRGHPACHDDVAVSLP